MTSSQQTYQSHQPRVWVSVCKLRTICVFISNKACGSVPKTATVQKECHIFEWRQSWHLRFTATDATGFGYFSVFVHFGKNIWLPRSWHWCQSPNSGYLVLPSLKLIPVGCFSKIGTFSLGTKIIGIIFMGAVKQNIWTSIVLTHIDIVLDIKSQQWSFCTIILCAVG